VSHSYRRAIIGSTFVARRAGIQQAASATSVSNNATAMNVSGSVALTPNRRPETQFAPDGAWLAFHVPISPSRTTVFVGRLRDGRAVAQEEWIAVTDGSGLDAFPKWSPDGGALSFLSQRDGFLCLWTQRLDPVTKRPREAPSDVLHFHRPGNSINAHFGGSVRRDMLFFSMADVSGNLWLAEPEGRR
jgi:Tol biopolymer transport system component